MWLPAAAAAAVWWSTTRRRPTIFMYTHFATKPTHGDGASILDADDSIQHSYRRRMYTRNVGGEIHLIGVCKLWIMDAKLFAWDHFIIAARFAL
jgi:hypothetical protein